MTRSGDDPFGFDSLDLDWLRSKPGGKWHKHPGLLAAWIADMDFPPPPVVTAAMQRLVDQGDLGYPVHSPGPSPTLQVFVDRMRDRFGWHIERTHTRELNDVMQGVQMALHHGTEPGDGVVVFVPSYPPFLDTVHDNQRRLVPVAGHRSASSPTGWEFSLDEFADTVARERPRALLLCHPQNPTGHVWSEDELRRIAEVADEHDLLVVSDEIHSDLTFAPHVHRPFALFSPNRTVTVTAASKAFNLAALRYAVMHVGPEYLLATVKSAPDHLYGAANLFGAEAARAAWSAPCTSVVSVFARCRCAVRKDAFAACSRRRSAVSAGGSSVSRRRSASTSSSSCSIQNCQKAKGLVRAGSSQIANNENAAKAMRVPAISRGAVRQRLLHGGAADIVAGVIELARIAEHIPVGHDDLRAPGVV